MSQRHSLVARLERSKPLLGLLQSYPHPVLTELAAMCGYDFLMLDVEHGLFTERECLQTLQVLAAHDVCAVVRLPGNDPHIVGRYMDIGADALVVPNISTADQAAALAAAMHYPPAGTRGMGAPLHRVTRYGAEVAAHLRDPKDGVSLIVMIETALGVTNAEAILSVSGVDGVLIGPADLSADLGCLGDFAQERYVQALARIERAARDRNKFLATAVHPGSPPEALAARGHHLMILGAEMPLIREAMSTQIAATRSRLAGASAGEVGNAQPA